MLADNHISIIYSGPILAEKLDGFAEILESRLGLDDLPLTMSQSVFSVFVEQMNNMIMYSAEKECFSGPDGRNFEVSKGIFIFGVFNKTYFMQSGNVIKNSDVELLKNQIDYLNTLDKNGLRQFYKQQMKAQNSNTGSKGGGLGLIEIARRATSKIDYEFTPHGGDMSYFTLYVTI
jgi:hypothetical protein